MSKKQRFFLVGASAILAVLAALSVATAQSPLGHNRESGMAPQERLAKPQLSDPPRQIEIGHVEYWMSCMVCHGDRGQGLTDEWRSVLDPEDMNCWQSKCHAPNHPPEGFEIPQQSPMVIGPGALSGYRTAADLFNYLRVKMPWAFPGLFDEETYWNLTAYLAEANGVDLPARPLGPDNGDEVLLIPNLPQAPHPAIAGEQIVAGMVAGLLFLGAALYWAAHRPWPGVAEGARDEKEG